MIWPAGSDARRSSASRKACSPLEAACFIPDGDRFVPTELARGPWDPEALHGGPAAALAARGIEGWEGELQLVRLTVEFLRPVPLLPLRLAVELRRPGRRAQLVQAILSDPEGREVCWAVGLRLRREQVVDRTELPPAEPPPPPPERAEPYTPLAEQTEHTAFHRQGVEIRAIGARTAWIRLRASIVAGEAPSPLLRAVAAADFGNGVSPVLDFRRYLYINPDLTVYLHRMPVGEWVGLQATTFAEPHGIGLAESALFDTEGRIGRSLQSLLLAPRASPP